MRIIYFHQHFITPSCGAGGTRSYEMARELIRRGHSVLMVCGAAEGRLLPIPKVKDGIRRGNIDGIEVLQLDLPYSNYDSFTRRTWIFLRFALLSVCVALREQYDLLFATSTPLTAALPGIVIKALRPKPFVFEVRDPWPEVPRAMGIIKSPVILWLARGFEWLAYRTADACIGLSPGMLDGITRVAPEQKSVALIPNGCDLDLFFPKQREIPELPAPDAGARFTALYAGAHGLANGLGAVLDAAACLKRDGRDDIAIMLVGDGREKPRLLQRAKEEGLDNCIFREAMPKNELAQIFRQADAGLMIFQNIPVFYDGTSPNKFFDYIASGLPVLINYPGWLTGIIEGHHCGLPVPPDDPEALAGALARLADHPAARREMGRNARRLAETAFNRKDLAGRFADCLEETAGVRGTNLPARDPGARLAASDRAV